MSINEEVYKKSKDKLFVYFEDETLERVMEGLNEFALKYIETNDCAFLINDIYINKVDELIKVMNESNYLGEMISGGYILPEELGYMKPHELFPERYKSIIEKKAYEHNQKKNKGSNIFSCKKCKQSNCEVTQKQTRAADEPATTFVKCLECGFNFKF
uniref:TFIIS-type domain-containing protein n=1 Tax=viral metagenome TaxID=1070528 RepID=A0A6C0HV52_9ZZZZ